MSSPLADLSGVSLGPPDADGLYDTQKVLDALAGVELREVVNEAIATLALNLGVETARRVVLGLQSRVEAMIMALHPGRVSPGMVAGCQLMIAHWASFNQDLDRLQAKHWEEHPEDKARLLNTLDARDGSAIPVTGPRPSTRVIRMRSAHHDNPS